MHLYLIRHGQSEENVRGWDGSNTNSVLSPLGEAQIKALAEWLAPRLTFDRLYASPMRRARQTAEAVAATMQVEPTFDDRLREVGNCYPNGLPFTDDALPTYFLDVWGSVKPYRPITVEGENWMQFRARVGGFLEWLLEQMPAEHQDYRVGVCCHGGVIEGFFEHIFQKGPWSTVVVGTHNTGLTHLEYAPSPDLPAWRLHYHNNTRHLSEDMIS